MSDILDMVEDLVDEHVGIIRQVHEVRREAGAPEFAYFSARTCNISALNPNQHERTIFGSGVSARRAMAMAKAVGEAIERYCAANYCAEDFPVTTFDAAPFPCVTPEEFALYTPDQHRHPRFPFAPFSRKTPVRWIPAHDLHAGEVRHVPAAMVFMPYAYNKEAGEEPITPQISTGLACHTHPVFAILAATYEVIERDAIAIAWQARMARRRIHLDTLSPTNTDLVRRLTRPGASVALLHLAMDHGITVIMSVMRSMLPDAPAFVVGAAAHLDPEQAVRKSLEELAQIWSFAQRVKVTQPNFAPGVEWENVVDPESHAAVYYDPANAGLAKFLFDSSKPIAFGELENLSTKDPIRDLRIVVDEVAALNHRVLIADVTSEDVRGLGLSVFRTVIPGLHPLFMGHKFRALGGSRLWNVPQTLGHPGLQQDEGDNPYPHPFA